MRTPPNTKNEQSLSNEIKNNIYRHMHFLQDEYIIYLYSYQMTY